MIERWGISKICALRHEGSKIPKIEAIDENGYDRSEDFRICPKTLRLQFRGTKSFKGTVGVLDD